jgi:Mrp family chromosome partitioning ATPase
MTRSIDNAFVRALSRKRPDPALELPTSPVPIKVKGIGGDDNILRIEMPEEGSAVAAPHLSFQTQTVSTGTVRPETTAPQPPTTPAPSPSLTDLGPSLTDLGPSLTDLGPSLTDLAAFLTFSADTYGVSSDTIPFAIPVVMPSAPPHPHIAPNAMPATQNPDGASDDTTDVATDPATDILKQAGVLNQSDVEQILTDREHELNVAFQRRMVIREAKTAQIPEYPGLHLPLDALTLGAAKSDLENQLGLISREIDVPTISEEVPSEEVSAPAVVSDAKTDEVVTDFQPAWEVDVFQWPETVEELFRTQGVQFAQAGEQLRQAAVDGLRVLGVTSTFRGEGRTSLATCIARCVASAGASVALVDLDPDHGDLAHSLKVRPTVGWRNAINDELSLEEAVIHSVQDGVSLVPLRSEDDSDIGLRDPRVVEMLTQLNERFDLVVLDCGPLVDDNKFLEGGESCPLDAAIVVRDMRTTSVEDCHATVGRLLQYGLEAVGIAENFLR